MSTRLTGVTKACILALWGHNAKLACTLHSQCQKLRLVDVQGPRTPETPKPQAIKL